MGKDQKLLNPHILIPLNPHKFSLRESSSISSMCLRQATNNIPRISSQNCRKTLDIEDLRF